MSKHTPAPWEVVEHSWAVTGIYASDSSGIAQLSIADTATEENQEELEAEQAANARLIAAAPEMLDALRAAFAELDIGNALHKVEAAIAKATGAPK